ncbi:MAG TPA: VOC family protein [Gaiellales bacterium]|nr:VOC family protein [Gaiellales bacterium]
MIEDARPVAFVGATDLDRAHDFYGGALGLPLVERTEIANVYDAGGDAASSDARRRDGRRGLTVLGWVVSNIHGAMAALAARGVAFERYPGVVQDEDGVWTAPGGSLIAWFRDPDGNTLSLQEPAADADPA